MTRAVRLAGLVALILWSAAAAAQEIPRPPARAAEAVPAEAAAPAEISPAEQVPSIRLRPRERPDLSIGYETRPQRRAEQDLFAFSPFAPRATGRPSTRPARIVQEATERRVMRERGAICGDVAIQGEAIGTIDGPGACGVEGAVRIRSIAGVTLQGEPTVDCRTAQAMKTWITDGIVPAVGGTGGGVSRLRVVAHYACRNRVGGSSGNRRLSEHALGQAIDIAGIGLKSGREITVLTDWNSRSDGAILRRIWQSACGPFGTVLGPEANAAHRDHFHVDTARYRSGAYCR